MSGRKKSVKSVRERFNELLRLKACGKLTKRQFEKELNKLLGVK